MKLWEIYFVIKDYAVDEEDIMAVIENVPEDFENKKREKRRKYYGKNNTRIFWRIRFGKWIR